MLNMQRLEMCLGEMVKLTNDREMTWQGNDMVGFRSEYKGTEIHAGNFDQPTLIINGASIEARGIGIEEVLQAIRNAEKKSKESPELKAQYRKWEDVQIKAAAENVEALNGSVRAFLRKRWS